MLVQKDDQITYLHASLLNFLALDLAIFVCHSYLQANRAVKIQPLTQAEHTQQFT